MKHLLLATIAVLLLVGYGSSVNIHEAAEIGYIEAIKQHLAAGTDVNPNIRTGPKRMVRSSR
jgi:predicted component of type VI protein secretion system